jgi:hypothetical protein
MARQAFFSFHYQHDSWRVSKVRNMGVIEGNRPATDNDWEAIVSNGDNEIEKWIDRQMSGKSVLIVLKGENTAGRKWIKHEIKKAWNDGKGLLGVYIHNITDANNEKTGKGRNPFSDFKIGKQKLSDIVKTYDPPYNTSAYVYNHIKENLDDWIENAIQIRKNYG